MNAKKNTKSDLKAKKKHVLTQSKRKPNLIYIILTAVVLVCAAAIAFIITATGQPYQSSSKSQAIRNQSTSSDRVVYPIAMFQDGAARHFEHRAGDLTIRYFVLKSSDGLLRAAFDACDVCWPAGKGYYQEGDDMVCRNCGRRFVSTLINEVKGGCNPAPLTRTVQADQLVIQVRDILQGQSYFNFKERG
jgi:uncharacterized membrane protein